MMIARFGELAPPHVARPAINTSVWARELLSRLPFAYSKVLA
jgi:hypothetical protein